MKRDPIVHEGGVNGDFLGLDITLNLFSSLDRSVKLLVSKSPGVGSRVVGDDLAGA